MTRFVVRVELPNKPHGDYGLLHEEMHAARYYTVVRRVIGVGPRANPAVLKAGDREAAGDSE